MNSNTQKLVAYVALVFVAAALLGVWGYFAFSGKTDVSTFISKLSEVLGTVITAIATLGGVHIASSRGSVAPPAAPSAPAAAPTVVVTE